MPGLVRKNRIISVRLSQAEFEALKTLYAARGARSISDFIRSAMNRIISEASRESAGALELKVQEIDGKVSILDGEVARLSSLLEGRHDHEN